MHIHIRLNEAIYNTYLDCFQPNKIRRCHSDFMLIHTCGNSPDLAIRKYSSLGDLFKTYLRHARGISTFFGISARGDWLQVMNRTKYHRHSVIHTSTKEYYNALSIFRTTSNIGTRRSRPIQDYPSDFKSFSSTVAVCMARELDVSPSALRHSRSCCYSL